MAKKLGLINKLIVGIPLALGLLFNPLPSHAQGDCSVTKGTQIEERYSPKLKIILKDPRTNSESNTQLTQTGVELLGETVNYAGKKIEKNIESEPKKVLLRGLETLFYGKASTELQKASHEYGHYRAGEENGAKGVKVNLPSPFSLFERGSYSFEYLDGARILESPTEGKIFLIPSKKKNTDAILKIIQGGPNQTSSNALDSFRKSNLEGEKIYNKIDRLATRASQPIYLSLEYNDGIGNDYKDMVRFMNSVGQKVSKEQMQKNNIVLNALSLDNWESLYSVWKFLKDGQREFKPLRLKMGENLEIGAPYLSHFITPDGEYVELTEFIWAGKNKTPIEISLSSDLGFTQEKSNLDNVRAMIKAYGLNTGLKNITISPYGSVNFARTNGKYSGFGCGLEAKVPLKNEWSLNGKIEYNKGDLDATTHGRDGFYGWIGISKGFNYF